MIPSTTDILIRCQQGDKEAFRRVVETHQRMVFSLALKMLAVFIFVAIPLPLTGVWAGTAIAVFLNLKFHQAILPVCLGNFVAGLLISGLAEFCLWVSGTTAILDYILWGLLALAVLLTVIMVIKINRKKGGGAR